MKFIITLALGLSIGCLSFATPKSAKNAAKGASCKILAEVNGRSLPEETLIVDAPGDCVAEKQSYQIPGSATMISVGYLGPCEAEKRPAHIGLLEAVDSQTHGYSKTWSANSNYMQKASLQFSSKGEIPVNVIAHCTVN